MSRVEVSIGGKEVGLADQASIDLMSGCDNKCIGCYAAKSSRQGKKFFENDPVVKEYDDEYFRKSVRRALKKSINHTRLGKHSDPGSMLCSGMLNQVLTTAGEEGMRIVLVTKSLGFRDEIAATLKQYNHTLHISLGMISQAIENEFRFRNYRLYKGYGVNVKCRIVEDVTDRVPNEYLRYLKYLPLEDILVTPMRFSGKGDVKAYGVDISQYVWENGYYRPKELHKEWEIFPHFCGEVGSKILCKNCLIGECNVV